MARHFILGRDCGTMSAFPLRWTVLLFSPPRGCHVLSTYFFILSLSHSLSLSLYLSSPLSLSLLSISQSPDSLSDGPRTPATDITADDNIAGTDIMVDGDITGTEVDDGISDKRTARPRRTAKPTTQLADFIYF